MSSDRFNAALLQRIDRLEKLLLARDEQLRSALADRDAQITALQVELKEWKEDGYRRWLWSGSGKQTTGFHITSQRNRDSFEEVVPTSSEGFVMTDGYTAYNAIPTGQHAECWAHILRKARWS